MSFSGVSFPGGDLIAWMLRNLNIEDQSEFACLPFSVFVKARLKFHNCFYQLLELTILSAALLRHIKL